MKNIIVTLCFVVAIVCNVNAQIKATTDEGVRVLLFEDGTWKNEPVVAENTTPLTIQPEMRSQKLAFFEGISLRLKKYFNDQISTIQCLAAITTVDSQAYLELEWQSKIGDADRYFGTLKKGNRIELDLASGQTMELFYNDQIEAKYLVDHNISVFKGLLPLNSQELLTLSQSEVIACRVFWKKNTEEYSITDRTILMDMIKSVEQ